MAQRPNFAKALKSFSTVNVSVAEVGKIIGGKVQDNIDARIFTNACAIRMSYVLNENGVTIPNAPYATVSGADKRRYIFRVRDIMSFIEATFGKPDIEKKSPKYSDFSARKGILTFVVSGWADATGHATLHDGVTCSDHCYFVEDSSGKGYVPTLARLWVLK